MADDRLFRVIVLGGMALIGAAPASAGCTPGYAPGEGTLVPQSQSVVVPQATAPVTTGAALDPPLPPREGPPPPHNVVPIAPSRPVDAGAPPPPPAADAGADIEPRPTPPREGPPPRPRRGF